MDAEEVVVMERSVAELLAGLINGLTGIFCAAKQKNNEADNDPIPLKATPLGLIYAPVLTAATPGTHIK